MSKARSSTQETMVFTRETRDDELDGNKKRARKTTARVIGKPSMRDDDDADEPVAPAAKAENLMGHAIKARAAPPKPKVSPKASAPKRSTRDTCS